MVQKIYNIIKNIWIFVCDQFVALFFIATIGLKLAFFNGEVLKVTWPTDQYLCGVAFGFLSIAIIFSPLFFVRKKKNISAIIIASIITTLLLVDHVYYSYFSTLPTIGLFSSIGQASDVGPAIGTLLNWQLLLYFVDIALMVILLAPIKKLNTKIKKYYGITKDLNHKLSIIIVSSLIIVFGASMSFMGKNSIIGMLNYGYDTASTAQFYGVLIAHVVDVSRFIGQETATLSGEVKQSVINWVKSNKPEIKADSMTAKAQGKNVIMVQVESLSSFVMNQTIDNQEITPNLNALSKKSNYFPNDRFIIGAGHTSDTDFVANTSYFPIEDAATFVKYGQDNFTSLPKTLAAADYSTYAFHGFNRNFWNRNVAYGSLGYEKFFAADNYQKGEIINMGLSDGDFLSQTADIIKDQPKPSLSYVVTLSSHVPFTTTDNSRGLKIDGGKYPYLIGDYLQLINYTDRMLGKFFDKLKKDGLYDDSLIIVYGDHTPVLASFEAGTIKYDPDSDQSKEVPLMIKMPNQETGITYPNTGTHLDIMPTVLDLLGLKSKQLMFGQSLFTNTNTLKVCNNQLATFKIIDDCSVDLQAMKNKSEQIIRNNLFDSIQ